MAEKKSENCRINKLETTDDTLTSRGGLTFFVKYVGSVGVLGLLLEKFTGIKKSAKGVSVGNLFLQALYFFFDGTSRHLSYFDELKKDAGNAARDARQASGVLACDETIFLRFWHFQGGWIPVGVEASVHLAAQAEETASGDDDAGHHGDG